MQYDFTFQHVHGHISCTHAVYRYTEVWEKRASLIKANKNKQQTYESYPKYPSKEDTAVLEFCTKVTSQLSIYKNGRGIFSRTWVLSAAEKMPAHLWWDQHGSSVPELQAFARLVLAQPASASICERINSEFEFVKDRRRNRLQHARANKLVSLFHNLRLLKRMKKLAYVEPAVGWTDDDGTQSGITKWGVDNYE